MKTKKLAVMDMKEEFLHFLWKHKMIPFSKLLTTDHVPIEIFNYGLFNEIAGPDFLNAKIKIGNLLWVGHVEFHLNSSDWYHHHHENDENYSTVVLHVVWNHDVEVFTQDNKLLPTLELKNLISPPLIANYKSLMQKNQSWIPCESSLKEIDSFTKTLWLEKLYITRLESKCDLIESLFLQLKGDWEALLFVLLSKNFGLKVNGDSFVKFATSFPF